MTQYPVSKVLFAVLEAAIIYLFIYFYVDQIR